MIPQFPTFKQISITDRAEVEAHTSQHLPYSDFNFTSLWSWDTKKRRLISQLNGNLVVQFTDYETHEPFLSFIGHNEPSHTASTLIEYAIASGISPILRLVPEESVRDITGSTLIAEEDRDNFDYVCSISELATLKGIKFKARRHMAARFRREYPTARFEIVDPTNETIGRYVSAVLHQWQTDRKFKDHEKYELENEHVAIERIFASAASLKLVVSVVFVDDIMRAFSIDEVVPQQYCMGHFWKADTRCRGIYDFFAQELALYLEADQVAFWNWEQDLGVKGLKKAKMSYRPAHFLKKYRVSLAM